MTKVVTIWLKIEYSHNVLLVNHSFLFIENGTCVLQLDM